MAAEVSAAQAAVLVWAVKKLCDVDHRLFLPQMQSISLDRPARSIPSWISSGTRVPSPVLLGNSLNLTDATQV
jgi:hypothetical protein